MVIPETGLLLEPTIPTIREDTVAKKKPKITTKAAPIGLIGITGTITIKAAIATTPPIMNFMERS